MPPAVQRDPGKQRGGSTTSWRPRATLSSPTGSRRRRARPWSTVRVRPRSSPTGRTWRLRSTPSWRGS